MYIATGGPRSTLGVRCGATHRRKNSTHRKNSISLLVWLGLNFGLLYLSVKESRDCLTARQTGNNGVLIASPHLIPPHVSRYTLCEDRLYSGRPVGAERGRGPNEQRDEGAWNDLPSSVLLSIAHGKGRAGHRLARWYPICLRPLGKAPWLLSARRSSVPYCDSRRRPSPFLSPSDPREAGAKREGKRGRGPAVLHPRAAVAEGTSRHFCLASYASSILWSHSSSLASAGQSMQAVRTIWKGLIDSSCSEACRFGRVVRVPRQLLSRRDRDREGEIDEKDTDDLILSRWTSTLESTGRVVYLRGASGT